MNNNQNSHERFYKAFISYRHKPLDIWTAKRMHRRIERYTIPQELRKDGEKKLGLVFRDQDELTIANSLSENIKTALDHSEYLIVICTPDTPESEWVHKEIAYFLEHHDRDKLLAVLADGEPEQSFPELLTNVKDENGRIVEEIEPLAANIVASSVGKRMRLFNTESLRILAALIGCPYDDLYHREQRYKRRRAAAAAAAVMLVSFAFIGLLLNRNAKIHEQLMTSQILESKALAAQSQAAFRNGDYCGALNAALEALPARNPDRPYVAEAEYALAEDLYLYQCCDYQYIRSFDQDTEIKDVELSGDEKYLATLDSYNKVRMYNVDSGELLWEKSLDDDADYFQSTQNGLLVEGGSSCCLYGSNDGNPVWEYQNCSIGAFQKQTGSCLLYQRDINSIKLWIADTDTGEIKANDYISIDSDDTFWDVEAAALSPDDRYAAIVYSNKTDEDGETRLILWDYKNGGGKLLQKGMPYRFWTTSYEVCFGENNTLALVCSVNDLLDEKAEDLGKSFATMFDGNKDWERIFKTGVDFGNADEPIYGRSFTFGNVDYLNITDEGMIIAGRNRLICLNTENGKIIWQKDLGGRVLSAEKRENKKNLFLVMSDGHIDECYLQGQLSYQLGHGGGFDCNYDIIVADCVGNASKNTSIAVVPKDDRSRAAVISYVDEPYMEQVPGMEDKRNVEELISSPSGNMVAVRIYNDGLKKGQFVLVDPTGEKDVKVYDVPDEFDDSLLDDDEHFLTDSGLLISRDLVFDPEKGTVTCFTKDKDNPEYVTVYRDAPGCIVKEDNCVLQAVPDWDPEKKTYNLQMIRDGVPTEAVSVPQGDVALESLNHISCSAVSPQGDALVSFNRYSRNPSHAIYRQSDKRWYDVSFLGEEQVVGLGEKHPWLAVQNAEKELNIYDVTTMDEFTDTADPYAESEDSVEDNSETDPGTDEAANGSGEGDSTAPKPLISINNNLPAGSISKIIFFRDDTRLATFCSGGAILIYDTENGSLLNNITKDSEQFLFQGEDEYYEIQEVPEKGMTLFIYYGKDYRDPICFAVDSETFEIKGLYRTFYKYLPERDKVYTKSNMGGIRTCRLFTIEDIQKMANERLVSAEGTQE